jgi:hypothetical protein
MAAGSSNNKKLLIALLIITGIVFLYFSVRKNTPTTNDEKSRSSLNGTAPSDFHGIPPEGTGGDPELNKEKNRWFAPAEFSGWSVSQIISLPHDALDIMGKEKRSRWSSSAIEQAAANENHGVQVIGYIAHAKESGAEACNGKSDTYHDYHIWITESPGEDKSQGIIVEAIPYWKEQFPAWKLETFEKLASENAKVRVTGWLLWDEEHGDEVGKSRGSLWEVHPFTKFEIFSGGRWVELGRDAS